MKYLLAFFLLLAACEKTPVKQLTTEAYVWQRPDKPEVLAAVKESSDFISIHHVRAAEMKWVDGRFITDMALTQLPGFRCGLVVRIGASASKLDWTQERIAVVVDVFEKLAALKPSEIQCDFDCPQSRLAGYAVLLEALRKRCGKVPVVPTVLPSWLDEPEFQKLISKLDHAPGYVLQVHSLELPKDPGEAPVIFDADAARGYARKASSLGKPYRIAMATYGCEVRFGADGKVIDVVSEDTGGMFDSPATRSFALADPVESARLARDWTGNPPKFLTGIIWYRLPIPTDQRNWPMETLRLVAHGEISECAAELISTGNSATKDMFMVNRGAFPVKLPGHFSINTAMKAADGVGAYRIVREGEGAEFFLREGIWPWLDPGKQVACGWMIPRDEAGKKSETHAADGLPR